jgi:hypothetical protein
MNGSTSRSVAKAANGGGGHEGQQGAGAGEIGPRFRCRHDLEAAYDPAEKVTASITIRLSPEPEELTPLP